jgi:hypothetical protein
MVKLGFLDRLSRILFTTTFLIVVLDAGVVAIGWGHLPPQIPLFFSLPWGEGRLVSPTWLALPAAASLVILLINLVVARFMNEVVLTRILGSTSLLVALVFFIAVLKISLVALP